MPDTLDVQHDGGLGAGDVTVSNATLTLQAGIDNTYINSSADLLLNGAFPLVNLSFFGTNTIHALSFDGGVSCQPAGVYGPPGSGATYESSFFAGFGYLNVVAGPSATTLASSANPAVYGTLVTFTATVTGPGATPTGTVFFKDGATVLGTGTLDPAGVATFTTNKLTVAGSPRSITATYIGDSVYGRSISSVLFQTNTATTVVPSVTVASKTYDGTVNATLIDRSSAA